MSHNCRIGNIAEVIEDPQGYLTLEIKSFYPSSPQNMYRRIEYCPVCGEKCKKSNVFQVHLTQNPPLPEDPIINGFSNILSESIAQMNHNIELIKVFMSSQNCQNELFLDRQMDFEQRLKELEKKNEL